MAPAALAKAGINIAIIQHQSAAIMNGFAAGLVGGKDGFPVGQGGAGKLCLVNCGDTAAGDWFAVAKKHAGWAVILCQNGNI